VIFRVPAAARITVPSGGNWSFPGSPGSTARVLPQADRGFTQAATYTVTFEVTARLAGTGATGPKAFALTVLP
jgi:hypothetical protein